MKFLDYITNIETLTDIKNEGDGDIIFHFQVNGFGVSGDGEARIEIPYIQSEGWGEHVVWGKVEFPIFQILAQNTNSADIEIYFEVEGLMSEPNIGLTQLVVIEVEAEGRSGNVGECYFYLAVGGEGNANREYELCN